MDPAYVTIFYQTPVVQGALDPVTWPLVAINAPAQACNIVFNSPGDGFLTAAFASIAAPNKANFNSWNGVAPSAVNLVQANNNGPINLAIIAHGQPGTVIGDINLTSANVKAFLGNNIAGKVQNIFFYSCLTGQLPPGGQFLTNLSAAASVQGVQVTSTAYTDVIYVSPDGNGGYTWCAGDSANTTTR